MKTVNPIQLNAANKVLAMFAPGSRIVRQMDGWYVVWQRWETTIKKRWLTRNQDFFPPWLNKWGHGGTACTALSQLIRWLQKRAVVPISTWQYWASERVRLLPPEAADILLAAHYPTFASCVLCGCRLTRFDWWHLGGVSGPCCNYTEGCRQKQTQKESKGK